MLGLDQNQAIQAIEEILVKLKSGEAKLFRFDFTADARQLSVLTSGPQAVQASRPTFKIEMELAMGVPEPQRNGDWGDDVPDEDFTIGQDGLPATDEYAWSTSADVQRRTMKVVNGTTRPSFAGDIARQLLGPRRREFTAPVKAPKAKKQFGSRDLDID